MSLLWQCNLSTLLGIDDIWGGLDVLISTPLHIPLLHLSSQVMVVGSLDCVCCFLYRGFGVMHGILDVFSMILGFLVDKIGKRGPL